MQNITSLENRRQEMAVAFAQTSNYGVEYRQFLDIDKVWCKDTSSLSLLHVVLFAVRVFQLLQNSRITPVTRLYMPTFPDCNFTLRPSLK